MDLFMYEDICNVYLLKGGGSGVLIDLGNGFLGRYPRVEAGCILRPYHMPSNGDVHVTPSG